MLILSCVTLVGMSASSGLSIETPVSRSARRTAATQAPLIGIVSRRRRRPPRRCTGRRLVGVRKTTKSSCPPFKLSPEQRAVGCATDRNGDGAIELAGTPAIVAGMSPVLQWNRGATGLGFPIQSPLVNNQCSGSHLD